MTATHLTQLLAPESARAVTSASNIFRRALCPGSAVAELGIIDEESDYSAEGTLLHRLILHRISPAAAPVPAAVVLTHEQAETLNEAERLFTLFLADVTREFGIPEDEPFVDQCEQTLTVHGADGAPLYPGHADLIRHWPRLHVSLIADWKFGFLEVEEAPDNTQLASYSVAHEQAVAIHRTAVGIIQPRAFGPRLTRAIYDLRAADLALAELERIVIASRDPNAPRIAGAKQCAHCKARLFCDAYKAKLLPAGRGVRDVSLLDNDDLWRLKEACSFAAAIVKKVNAELRRRIQNEECEGILQSTGSTKTIPDCSAYYRRLQAFFPKTPDLALRFMACLKPTWEKLTDLGMDLTGLPQKKARAKMEEIGAGLIEEEEKEKTPKRAVSQPSTLNPQLSTLNSQPSAE